MTGEEEARENGRAMAVEAMRQGAAVLRQIGRMAGRRGWPAAEADGERHAAILDALAGADPEVIAAVLAGGLRAG